MDKKNKQQLYNTWHKEIYQPDLKIASDKSRRLYKAAILYLEIDKNVNGKLLDVACGKGLLLKEINSNNSKLQLFGSDISDFAISIARENVDAVFSVDNGEKLSLKSNFFDYVTCLGGLEYYDSPINGAKEIARVLKKNGKSVIFVPNLMFLGYMWLAFRNGMMPTHGGSYKGKVVYDYNDEKFYTFQGWKDILEKGGLNIIKSYKYSYIGSTKFANKYILWLYNRFLFRFIPFNLAYSFVFFCKKN
ncbi:MAG: class I SAM-dependent methyltransferase [Candidatus Levybacteria bacterium]|nr:class I SAM-dependent methyltransferase [Candidatus Levybacteria bacterium]